MLPGALIALIRDCSVRGANTVAFSALPLETSQENTLLIARLVEPTLELKLPSDLKFLTLLNT